MVAMACLFVEWMNVLKTIESWNISNIMKEVYISFKLYEK